MRRSIIVGVECSGEATDAARVGASLARRLDRSLVLAHVVDDRREIRSTAELLTSVATEIGEPGARKRVSVIDVTDGPDRGLANLVREEDADLLVVGSHSRGPLPGPRGTRAFHSLPKSSPSPVIVVPAGATNRFAGSRPAAGPVVCGIDWSLESGAARVVAESLAGQLGLAVMPIYVDQIGPWANTLQGVQVEVGDPAEVLARAAERETAPLIVIGMHNRETLIPSVSCALARMAPVPVLIVPSDSRLPRFTSAAGVELIRAAELVEAA